MKTLFALRSLFFALACASLLSACGKSDGPESALNDESGLLRYVPADSPYVFARLAPLPEDFRRKVEPQAELINEQNRQMLEKVFAMEGLDESPEGEKVLDLARRFLELGSEEGLTRAGLERDAPILVYGNGERPVVRMLLSDQAKFEAELNTVLADMEMQLTEASLGDVMYRYADLGEFKILVLIHDQQAVVSVDMETTPDTDLSTLLGLLLPAENIAEAGLLSGIAAEHGFEDHHIGYVNVESLITRALALPATSELSAECRSEIAAMTAVAPRVVMGFTEVSAKSIDSKMVIELREDLAKGLVGLSSPVPGLGTHRGPVATFGMSFRAKVARAFVEKRLEAMAETPYECEFMQDWNVAVSQARDTLAKQPIPPTVNDFKGFLVSLDSLDGLTPGQQPDFELGKFSALLSIDNAESVMALGNMFAPEIAALELKPNGDVVEVSTERLGTSAAQGWVSLDKDAIGVAAGEGGDKRLKSLMRAPAKADAPLFYVDIDAGEYMRLISEAMQMSPADDDELEIRDSTVKVLEAVGNLYDRMSVDVRTTEKGVEISSSATLQ